MGQQVEVFVVLIAALVALVGTFVGSNFAFVLHNKKDNRKEVDRQFDRINEILIILFERQEVLGGIIEDYGSHRKKGNYVVNLTR